MYIYYKVYNMLYAERIQSFMEISIHIIITIILLPNSNNIVAYSLIAL